MFFDRFEALCKAKGISCKKAALEIGFSNSLQTRWRNGSAPNAENVAAIATYFGVSTDYLLGVVTLSEEEQKELFSIFARACGEVQMSHERAQSEAKISNKTNIIEKLGFGRMPRVSMDDLYAIADVLGCREEVEAFLGKIKKPIAIESDELLRQTDEVKELLKKIAPEQRESVLQMLRTFAAEK